MPQYYKVLDNGQDSEQRRRNAARGRSAKKTMSTASANANTTRGRDVKAEIRKYGRKGTQYLYANERRGIKGSGQYDEEFMTAAQKANQRKASKAAAKPKRKKWNSVDAEYTSRVIYNAQERKKKMGGKR